VLRFWSRDIMNNIDDVLTVIWNVLHEGVAEDET
jgi:very-short-patch-repair endonuclease